MKHLARIGLGLAVLWLAGMGLLIFAWVVEWAMKHQQLFALLLAIPVVLVGSYVIGRFILEDRSA